MFIAVDGIDGAGKTTLVQQLAELLGSLNPVITKEPTDNSKWGQKLRIAAVEGRLSRDKELDYFHKDRLHHIKTVIKPALGVDRLVLSDRYVDSTLAFQANTPKEADELYESMLSELLIPDITFILKCPYQTGLQRLKNRDGDNLTQFENEVALKRAASIYESRNGDNYEIIDSSGSPEETLKLAVSALIERFNDLSEIIETVNIPPLNSGKCLQLAD